MNEPNKLPIPYKKYGNTQCIDQKAANAMLDDEQTFKKGDPHPSIADLVVREMMRGKPYWMTQEGLIKRKKAARKANAEWQKNNRESVRASNAKWQKNNRESVRARHAKWRQNNSEKYRARSAKWREDNREHVRAHKAKWQKDNAYKVNAKVARRRAQKFGADVDEFGVSQYTAYDKAITEQMYAHAGRLKECLGGDWDIDHVLPLNSGGSNRVNNLQLTPASWNHSKGDRNTNVFGAWEGVPDYSFFNK